MNPSNYVTGPSRKTHRLHHLAWDSAKKRFKLRATVKVGEKVVGRRVTIHFHTSDAEAAIHQRDGAFAAFRALGLKLMDRDQRRNDPASPALTLLLPAPRQEHGPVEAEPSPATKRIPADDPGSPLRWGAVRGRE